jgi:hypothetical protein
MAHQGVSGGAALEGLTYLAILVTGVWSTGSALMLSRLLGFSRNPTRKRAVLVGAHALTFELARQLIEARRTTVVIDAANWRLRRFSGSGISTIHGDARDVATYEEAGVESDSLILAATTNDELNLLVAELVRGEFGVEHPVVALQAPPDELGRRSRAWIDLLGGGSLDLPYWIRQVEDGTTRTVSIDVGDLEAVARLREAELAYRTDVLRVVGLRDGEPSLAVSDRDLDQLHALTLLVGSRVPATVFAADPGRAAADGTTTVHSGPPTQPSPHP